MKNNCPPLDEDVLLITIAGLLHDIGKLVHPVVVNRSLKEDYDLGKKDLTSGYRKLETYSGVYSRETEKYQRQVGLYCPFNKEANYYSHEHALYSVLFLEDIHKSMSLPPPIMSPGFGGLSESFINILGKHHVPEDNPLLWIITEADRISSGLDRHNTGDENNFDPKSYRSVRLKSLFATLRTDNTSSPNPIDFRYQLDGKDIFPYPSESQQKDDVHDREAYEVLLRDIEEGFKNLNHRDDLALWLENLDSYLSKSIANIPADRSGKSDPDVSLYDHSKTTAAIAAALYLFHRDKGCLTLEQVKNRELKPFLLVQGAFGGIQDFIFSETETDKFKSKLLRAKSFSVSLYMELFADMLCRKIGLTSVSVLQCSSGKFLALLPNIESAQEAIADAQIAANEWLLNRQFGLSNIRVASVVCSAKDFEAKNDSYKNTLNKLFDILEEQKFRPFDLLKYGGIIESENRDAKDRCPLSETHGAGKNWNNTCNSRKEDFKNIPPSHWYQDLIYIGENSVKSSYLKIYLDRKTADQENQVFLDPIFGIYTLKFSGNADIQNEREKPCRCWLLDATADLSKGVPFVAKKNLGGYVPLSSADEVMTFENIAEKAREERDEGEKYGVPALALLKLDIDNLGALFSKGISQGKYTVSRLSTLSRQFDRFFSEHLTTLITEKYPYVYTVFAGGDDSMFICPWNQARLFADSIRTELARYTCKNPDITISAGVAVEKPGTPLRTFIERAEKALESSKANSLDNKVKNSFTMFSETISWNQYDDLDEFKNHLITLRDEYEFSKQKLYRLNQFIGMVETEQRFTQGKSQKKNDFSALRWRALLSYYMYREIAGSNFREDKRAYLSELDQLKKELIDHLERLKGKTRIPLWEILYESRTR